MYPARRTSASARPASACYPTQHSPNSYSPQQPEARPTRYPMPPYAAHMQPPPPPPPPPAASQDQQYYHQQPSTSYSHLAPTALTHVLRPPSPRPERPPRPSSSYVQEYPYAGQAHASQAPPLPPKIPFHNESEPGTSTPRARQQQLPAYSSADSYTPPTLYPPDKPPIEPSPEDDPESEEAQLARALAASAAEAQNEEEELRKAIEESLALSSASPSPATDAWEEYDPRAFEPATSLDPIVPRPLDAGYGNGKGKERAPPVPEVILLRADSSSSSSESGWEEYDPRAFDFPRSVTDDLRERLSSASSISLATTTSSEDSRARAEDERRLVEEMQLEEEQLTRERDEQIARDEELSRQLLEAEGLNGAQAPGEDREQWLDRVAQEVEDALRRKLVAAGELVPPSPNGPPPDEMTLPRYTESPSAAAGPLPSLPPTNPFAAQLSPHLFNGPITSPSPSSTVVELPTTPTPGIRPLPTQPQPHPLLHHHSEPILPHEEPRPHVLPHSASMPVPQIPGPSKMEREQLRLDAWAEEETVVAGQDVPHLEVGAAGVMTHISYGFTAPQMTYRLPPAPQVPDVIAIAPFPSPAFHMQAPSWRALLRALAHMSDTKIEATPRALAKLGGEPARLRAVVQFVKVPLADSPWRTVLYLSLDNRVPPNTQQAWRYTNNDTTRLPYNFPTPQPGAATQPLANTPEAPVYSFPAPHAELPLSMPGVARFLTEKMNDARTETSSRSSTRRLAKIVDACYPEVREKREPGDRRAALLGRFFGRGGARKGGMENDQTYDLVTPFRMDDWG